MKLQSKKWLVPVTAALVLVLAGSGSNASVAEAKEVIAYNEATTPHYDVVKRSEKITLDGKLDDKVWETVPAISGGFHFLGTRKKRRLLILKHLMTEPIFILHSTLWMRML